MPIFLLLTSYVALEIYVFIQVWDAFGFVNTFFALILSAIIGGGLVRTQSQAVLSRMQQPFTKAPEANVLQSAMVFIGGLLLIIPGFVSDVIGLLFILPGTRHLIAKLAQKKFSELMVRQARAGQAGQAGFGNFRVFTFGSGFPPPQGPRPSSRHETQDGPWERDVTPKVIDVVPLRTETREVPDDES